MCADQAPRPRGRGGPGRGRFRARQVVDPADSFHPADAHGRRFVQAQGSRWARTFVAFGELHGGARPLYFPAGARGEAGWQPARKRSGATISAMSCRMGPVSGSFRSRTPFRRLFCLARRPSAEVSAAGQITRTTSGGRGSNSGDAAADIRFHTMSRRMFSRRGMSRSEAPNPSTPMREPARMPSPCGRARRLQRWNSTWNRTSPTASTSCGTSGSTTPGRCGDNSNSRMCGSRMR